MAIIPNIIRNALNIKTKNILYAPFNFDFDVDIFAKSVHNYYVMSELIAYQKEKAKFTINKNYEPIDINNINIDIDIDLICCNNIINQVIPCKNLSTMLQVPLLIILHETKPDFVKKEDLFILYKHHQNDTIVSLSENINASWHFNIPVLDINNFDDIVKLATDKPFRVIPL